MLLWWWLKIHQINLIHGGSSCRQTGQEFKKQYHGISISIQVALKSLVRAAK